MVDEGRRRRERGQDVVVGAIQPKVDGQIARLLQQLEIIPLKQVDGCSVMDMETILRRHPRVCLVDGLAFDNPADAAHASRWQDVEQLLKEGISVMASINIGYIAEYQERVSRLTGKRVTQTVPVEFILEADEIVVVDAPANVCISKEGAEQDVEDRRRQLAELRELALVLAADVVDRQLEGYLQRNGVRQGWGTQERIMICLTPRANAARMLEVGRRIAESFHGELIAAHVHQKQLDPVNQRALDANLELARQAGARVEELAGEDSIQAIVDYAHTHGITQIFVGHSMREGWLTKIFGTPLDRLLRKRRGADVRVFPH
jgi:two-component system sensor histidine kinase KdpD